MRDFNYVAINKQGKSTSGVLSANSSKEAKEFLLSEGLTPLKLKVTGKQESKKVKAKSSTNRLKQRGKKIGK